MRDRSRGPGGRRRSLLLAGLGFAVLFLALQLWRPEPPAASLPSDGDLADHVPVPDDVRDILDRACADCHSDDTRWPWYSRVAPVSWWIARDVRHGRSNLDFSAWSRDPHAEPTPRQRIEWMCTDLRSGDMPPRAYRLVHPEARLSETEKARVCRWSEITLRRLGPAP